MFDINPDRYTDGQRAYAAGTNLRGLVDMSKAAHMAAEAEAEQRRAAGDFDHSAFQAAETAVNSYMLGFADAFLADFRRMAGRGGTRA